MRNEIQRLPRTEDRYLEYLASKLTELADGKTKRTLVNMPPRHLETLLGSEPTHEDKGEDNAK